MFYPMRVRARNAGDADRPRQFAEAGVVEGGEGTSVPKSPCGVRWFFSIVQRELASGASCLATSGTGADRFGDLSENSGGE